MVVVTWLQARTGGGRDGPGTGQGALPGWAEGPLVGLCKVRHCLGAGWPSCGPSLAPGLLGDVGQAPASSGLQLLTSHSRRLDPELRYPLGTRKKF